MCDTEFLVYGIRVEDNMFDAVLRARVPAAESDQWFYVRAASRRDALAYATNTVYADHQVYTLEGAPLLGSDMVRCESCPLNVPSSAEGESP